MKHSLVSMIQQASSLGEIRFAPKPVGDLPDISGQFIKTYSFSQSLFLPEKPIFLLTHPPNKVDLLRHQNEL